LCIKHKMITILHCCPKDFVEDMRPDFRIKINYLLLYSKPLTDFNVNSALELRPPLRLGSHGGYP